MLQSGPKIEAEAAAASIGYKGILNPLFCIRPEVHKADNSGGGPASAE